MNRIHENVDGIVETELAPELAAAVTRLRDTPTLDIAGIFSMLYTHLDRQVALADSKAQLVLTANAVLLATITLDQGSIARIFSPSRSPLERIALLLTVLVLITLFGSVWFALKTSRPKVVAPKQSTNLFFWGHACVVDDDAYVRQFMDLSINEVKENVIAQLYARSHVVSRKFKNVRYSLDFLFVALVLWALSRLLLAMA
jgi:hypothetical protein